VDARLVGDHAQAGQIRGVETELPDRGVGVLDEPSPEIGVDPRASDDPCAEHRPDVLLEGPDDAIDLLAGEDSFLYQQGFERQSARLDIARRFGTMSVVVVVMIVAAAHLTASR
jgi:hypothetical protein